MPADRLRSALRDSTSPLHKNLDDVVGDFGSQEAYMAYVRKTHRFRDTIESALADDSASNWTLDRIANLAATDIDDLGIDLLPETDSKVCFDTSARRLGAFYVLEGSSLGARLLLRRAEALGMRADLGARHLARQASDPRRWRVFLTVLEELPEDQHEAALAAARDTFSLALSIYSKTAHEFA
ncbi:MAG: biliverdin-producing heme oxygenase [Hoeflea sp.]|uniref:biliverdin-producing heme oxygenase n=1 Tax=Hoeflea sp. TaxID=1940281 RepID=UPI0032ECFBF5